MVGYHTRDVALSQKNTGPTSSQCKAESRFFRLFIGSRTSARQVSFVWLWRLHCRCCEGHVWEQLLRDSCIAADERLRGIGFALGTLEDRDRDPQTCHKWEPLSCPRNSQERLPRVRRKKTSDNCLHLIYIFASSHLHTYIFTSGIYICTFIDIFTSLHLRIYIFILHIRTSSSRLIFTSAHRHLCSSSHLYIYIFAHVPISHLQLFSLFFDSRLRRGWLRRSITKVNPLRISRVSQARHAGEIAFLSGSAQPSKVGR